jgi:hypothetical protein
MPAWGGWPIGSEEVSDGESREHLDATDAGVPNGGAILIRPDGFIGFRAASADETTMAALEST